jgi:hypothetical protein
MRRSILALATGLLLAIAAAVPAAASETEMCASGADFGTMHATHAQDGALDGAMNPGMHMGFAVCLP